MKGKAGSPETLSLVVVYSLSKALAISPLEIYKMPSSLVVDLLMVHGEAEKIKAEEMEKISKETNSKLRWYYGKAKLYWYSYC